MNRTRLLTAVFALLQVTCNQALLTAPEGSTMYVFANPLSIAANGGISVISAIVIEPAGTPVPDGTVVQFFTDLGHIDEQGKTNDGVARVNLVADARSGTAHVSALSGPIVPPAAIEIFIGGARTLHLIVTADPAQITVSRSTHITANVFDEFGNPVPNVACIFAVDGALEFMDSAGRPVFTDNNGRAEDVMRTRRATTAPQQGVKVTVTISAGTAAITGTVEVVINPSTAVAIPAFQ